jgi:two-component system, response regulator PdtaR
MMANETILIVEDNAIVAFSLQRSLARLGYNILDPVKSGEAAVAAVTAHKPDLILMDVGLAGEVDGVTAAERIQAIASTPVIYLTGHTQDSRLENTACLSKPVVWPELVALIKQTLRQVNVG